ncbi:RadC family protein [Methylomonas fluvii]|uniref:DNA repair protein RadC n=1 Tax=Methylomonas fluvii TaxID=1854564 RepID=A0ABR9DFA8_9GAMM|nr:DNA repair protein RadC [Methylomonas fluvii]MBD9361773.1 DNA repair protein RadC [Methylomonas fluvii]
MLYQRGHNRRYQVADDEAILFQALQIYQRRFSRGEALTSPDKAKDCIQIKLTPFEHEVFMAVFLDNQHKVIACEELFRGTIDGASVYPREVVKTALRHNAAALIFAHNHPSGISEPSQADRTITEKLKTALALIDIRVLDHFVVGETVYSFAEHGLL